MKKTLAFALVMVLALSLLTACGGGNPPANNSTQPGGSAAAPPANNSTQSGGSAATPPASDSNQTTVPANTPGETEAAGDGGEDFQYTQAFLDSALPNGYSITFLYPDMTGEGGEGMTMVMMKTPEGYYTRMKQGDYMDMQAIYLKNGDVFDIYTDWDGSGFSHFPGNTSTRDDIEVMFMHIGVVAQIESEFGWNLKKSGTETVAGRSCDVFSVTISEAGVSATMAYCFDQQTGMLLKWSAEGTENGVRETMSYEAIEFLTSGFSLPKHD